MPTNKPPHLVAVNNHVASAFYEITNEGTFHTDGNVESPTGWWAEFTFTTAEEVYGTFKDLSPHTVADVLATLMDGITIPAALLLRVDSDGNKELFAFPVTHSHETHVQSDAMEQVSDELTNEYLQWLLTSQRPMLMCNQSVPEGDAEYCTEKFGTLEGMYEHLVKEHHTNYAGEWDVLLAPAEELGM